MREISKIMTFFLEGRSFGLALPSVIRVLRMMEVTPLPHAPEIVLGVFDVHGTVVPVVDLRQRFQIPKRDPGIDDQIILARTPRRQLALVADRVGDVETVRDMDWIPVESVLPNSRYVAGVVKRADGLILIHDLDTFLALDEERTLDIALAGGGNLP